MNSLIGQRLGRYRIIDLIGEGSTATVYRGRPEAGGGDVAIKVIKHNLLEIGDFSARFKREARVALTLDHPHILKVYYYGQDSEILHIVMQMVAGGSLADLIEYQQLSLPVISSYMDQVASALDYAHQTGIVHRDLKPQNVLIDKSETLYLCDFGMVKSLSDIQTLTKAGTVLGTPAYISPEQCMTTKIDARADIYSLGVMLFELLTGQLPFTSPTPLGMMSMHCHKQPPLVSSVKPGLPAAIDEVVNRSLAKQPAERFASAGEMAAAFKAAIVTRAAPRSRKIVTPGTAQPASAQRFAKPNTVRNGGLQASKSQQAGGAVMQTLPARRQAQTVLLLATLLGLVAVIAVFVAILLSATR